jgi:predicted dehydrogenase
MKKTRYAVVGLGWFAQESVLPAFKNAKNSELVALVSGDDKKRRSLARKYKVKDAFTYDEYDDLLDSGMIDAVYIALPNDQHRDFAVRALQAGIHVLCEKPMALSSRQCELMIQASRETGAKLMIAYRLHFEEANLAAVELARKGKLGEPRVFSSVFSFPIKGKNIRARPISEGGGPLYDIGVYCINAARYLFRDEPIEVFAQAYGAGRTEVKGPDTFAVILKFPRDRVALFTLSYGVASVDYFQIVGTKGELCLDDAYSHQGPKHWWLTIGDKTKEKSFKARDQLAPELIYFSECIAKNREPEPSGVEGLADIRVIEAILDSVRLGYPVAIEQRVVKTERPSKRQEIKKPEAGSPGLVRAEDPQKKAA